MRKSNWPPERTALLLAMAKEGLCRREIAARLDVGINAVTTKLFILGMTVPLNSAKEPSGARVNRQCLRVLAAFPRFEDVTADEARAISAGAPRSAPYARWHDFSIVGNAGLLCAAL